MKKLNIIISLLATLFTANVHAITIAGVELATTANSVLGSNGNFYNYNSASASDTLTAAQLASDLTDTSEATYVFSIDSAAYVDMGFTGSNLIYNGDGADLALFFAGDFNSPDVFSLQINGVTQSYTPVGTPTPWTVNDQWGSYNLTYALIELDDFGLAGSQDALNPFRVFLGDSTRPALSLVGGFHTEATAYVPLPLPVLLFASGLGMLGLFARKRQQA